MLIVNLSSYNCQRCRYKQLSLGLENKEYHLMQDFGDIIGAQVAYFWSHWEQQYLKNRQVIITYDYLFSYSKNDSILRDANHEFH